MNKDNWVYFAMGLGIGAAVATLYAPASGDETRQMIAQKTSEGMDQLKNKGQAWKGSMTDAMNETVQRTKETVQKAGKTLQYGTQNVNAAVQAAKDAYKQSVETTPSA